MTKTKTITRKQAEAVLALVEKRYKAWLQGEPEDSPDRPKLVENYEPYWCSDDSGTRRIPWAILWESGPDEWAYRFSMGGIDEELATLAAEVVGQRKVQKAVRDGAFTEQPAPQASGVYVEPGCSFILFLYPGS